MSEVHFRDLRRNIHCGASHDPISPAKVESATQLIKSHHMCSIVASSSDHTLHTVHLLMKLVSPKTEMVEIPPRNLFMCVAIWTNQIASFDLEMFVLLQT